MTFFSVVTHWAQEPVAELGTTITRPYFATYTSTIKDVTGQEYPLPKEPNSVVVEGSCPDIVFGDIQSDPELFVLWDTPNPRPPDGTPGADEWAKLNAFLSGQGYSPQQRRDAIGLTPGGRSRSGIAKGLSEWIANSNDS